MDFRRMLMATAAAGLLAVAGAMPAHAQGADQRSGWAFQVALYAWLPTFNGTFNYQLPTGLGGNATVRADSNDYLSDLNFAAMIAGEARYDRFSVITDLMYVDLGAGSSRIDSINQAALPANPIGTTVTGSSDTSMNATIWTLGAGYTVARGDWGNVDLFGGFRLLSLNAETNYTLSADITDRRGGGIVLGRAGRLSGNEAIWNGIIGVRGRITLGNSGFFVPYYLDVGAGDSNLTWQGFTGVGYQTGWAGVIAGYRYLSFDQGGSDLVNKLSMGGAFLAVNFTF
ncbi:hypothetical protein GWK16_03290 [Roseomonas sp. JC162]|uniref:Outer membrane protein n=1 Tax=Neoroseomonas marina TaxID=1232220 RepID=A0A848EAE7_9PROT|nr:hypothetical protein [Neoroseomonas marina]NMJ40248.1 hypothetical protein [Neoroseomonas marina]